VKLQARGIEHGEVRSWRASAWRSCHSATQEEVVHALVDRVLTLRAVHRT